MDFASYFPVYDKLTPAQQQAITGSLIRRSVPKGTIVHNGSVECTGMVLVTAGQLGLMFCRRRAGRSPFTGCLKGIFACCPLPAL